MSERDHALALWARSGAMALSGRPDGPPVAAPGHPAAALAECLAALETWALDCAGARPQLPSVELLGERAAIAGLRRSGSRSCGGAFELIPTEDGFLGLSLARSSDVDLLPALLERRDVPEPWSAVRTWARHLPTREAVDRCRLLGLPCAEVPSTPMVREPVVTRATGGRRKLSERPRILDLTSLWAGPLCSHLLGLCGVDVIKVESRNRPDGARQGSAEFFDLLNAGKSMIALDFSEPSEFARLVELVHDVDLVLEASRPRALIQFGLVAEDVVREGVNWVSITAHGRDSHDVGFGDDTAAAGGLVAWDDQGPLVCGDALGDPLSGAAAALACVGALTSTHAQLLDVSMEAVCSSTVGPVADHEVVRTGETWSVVTGSGVFPVEPPRRRLEAIG